MWMNHIMTYTGIIQYGGVIQTFTYLYSLIIYLQIYYELLIRINQLQLTYFSYFHL